MSLRFKFTFIDVEQERGPVPKRSASLPSRLKAGSSGSLEKRYLTELAGRARVQGLPPAPTPVQPFIPTGMNSAPEMEPHAADPTIKSSLAQRLWAFFQQLLWTFHALKQALDSLSRKLQ